MLTFLKLKESYRAFSTTCERLNGPGQEVVHVTSAHFPLAGTQSHSFSNQREELGNSLL